MAEREEIEALLARVEAATGPDREIDKEIARLLGWSTVAPPRDSDRMFPSLWVSPDGNVKGALPPAYTSSLDAIVGLIEREISVYLLKITIAPAGNGAELTVWPKGLSGGIEETFTAVSVSPELACCAAFLRAAMEKTSD